MLKRRVSKLPIWDKPARLLMFIMLAILIVPPVYLAAAGYTYLYSDKAPIIKNVDFLSDLPAVLPELAGLEDVQPSIIYAQDGTKIGEFKPRIRRKLLTYEEIPQHTIDALTSAEDQSFFTHPGVDIRGITRAAWTNILAGSTEQGGSTITQQLIKLRTGEDSLTLERKIEEALKAVSLERNMTKEEILTEYLNSAYFGESAFGLEAAAQTYFNKEAKNLSIGESALLIGVIPAPSVYSPRANLDIALRRKNQVLGQMYTTGKLSQEEYKNVRDNEIVTITQVRTQGTTRYPYFQGYTRTFLLNEGGFTPEQLFGGGLEIYTTLKPDLQDYGIELIRTTLEKEDDPSSSLVALDPKTGHVLALVGGTDYSVSQVNLATGKLGGGGGRQPGSTFKPFVAAAAAETGIPLSTRYAAPSNIKPEGFTKEVWNYDRAGRGQQSIADALVTSTNTVFVQLILDAGIQTTAELARNLGLETLDPETAVGGIAIGVTETSPLEMASAYGVFANQGKKANATPILRIIERSSGKELVNNENPESWRVLQSETAFTVTEALQNVIENGTAKARGNIGRPAAGKTGTTDDYIDAWFVGYTPSLAASVWVGYPEGRVPMRNINGHSRVSGGTIPTAIWADFMKYATEGEPVEEFLEPGQEVGESGELVDIVRFDERAPREQKAFTVAPPQQTEVTLPQQNKSTPTLAVPTIPPTNAPILTTKPLATTTTQLRNTVPVTTTTQPAITTTIPAATTTTQKPTTTVTTTTAAVASLHKVDVKSTTFKKGTQDQTDLSVSVKLGDTVKLTNLSGSAANLSSSNHPGFAQLFLPADQAYEIELTAARNYQTGDILTINNSVNNTSLTIFIN